MTKIRILLLLLLAVVSQQIFAQERVVTGTVISAEDEQPVIGAMVAIKGDESRGVATDLNGEFSIALRPGDDRLVISYVGMRTRYARVDNKSNVRILLFPESTALQEVVVTGYGDFTRSSFTGSASTVKGDVLKDIPVVSVEQKLQGLLRRAASEKLFDHSIGQKRRLKGTYACDRVSIFCIAQNQPSLPALFYPNSILFT